MNYWAILLRSLKAKECDFLRKNCPGAGTVPKLPPTLVLLLRGTVNSELEIFEIAENTTSEAKERQHTAGKAIQPLFKIGPCTYYRYITLEEANSEFSTFIVKFQTVTLTDCVSSL